MADWLSRAVRLEETFDDGSILTESLVESESEIGRRFDITRESGGYFVIDLLVLQPHLKR